MTRPAVVAASLLCFTGALAGAQAARANDSAFTDLRRDGNGIGALAATIGIGVDSERADVALRSIAALKRLNMTFDAGLPGLATIVSIPARSRTVAAALIDIADAAKVRVQVAREGQLIVVALAPPGTTKAVILPAVLSEAGRLERRGFDTDAEVGGVRITAGALRSAPAFVEPDVMRAVQLLPGIEARSDYAAGFNVRGGENDQNLILIDGYPVYNPYHLGGLFSTFIGATVASVDLRRGGLPVRYGGRLSGVLDVQSAEPVRAGLHGTADVSLVSSSGSAGSAFGDGNGSWMIAARRTYADVIANLFHPDAFPYHFQDAQAHVARRIGGFRVSLTAYDGLDASASRKTDATGANWGNGVIGATLAKSFAAPRVFGVPQSDSIVLEQRLSLTRFDSRIDVPTAVFHADDRVTERRAAGSLGLFWPRLAQTVGYEVAGQRLRFNSNAAYTGVTDFIPFDSVQQHVSTASAYADQLWRIAPSLLVEAGARVDRVDEAHWTGTSPRASLKYLVGDNVAITAAAGRYAQWMHSLGREEEPVQPLQFWVASDSTMPVSRSRDVTLGLERWITPRRLLDVEAFHKRYDDVLVPNPLNDPGVRGDEFMTTRGTSYGFDVLLRQLEGGPYSGWIAYTYMRNQRIRDDGTRYAPPQDRRHNLNVVGSWRVGANVLGAHVALASGTPTTRVLGGFTREHYNPFTHVWVPDPGSKNDEYISDAPYGIRLPMYKRVDVSWSHPLVFHGIPLTTYSSIVNVFNFKNPAAYLYTFGYDANRLSFPNLPIAPTFGVSFAY